MTRPARLSVSPDDAILHGRAETGVWDGRQFIRCSERETPMICGIDPGQQGAIAWLSSDGYLIEVRDLPVTKGDGLIPAVLADWLRAPGRMPAHAFVERVAARPGAGVSGMFRFGRGYGQIEGVLAAVGIAVTLVTPGKWKGALRIPADKAASRARAAQLWPGLAGCFARVRDDGRAEAALIGLYGANSTRSVS
jgi:crossover junction endodeoxyribonuclease RuvC